MGCMAFNALRILFFKSLLSILLNHFDAHVTCIHNLFVVGYFYFFFNHSFATIAIGTCTAAMNRKMSGSTVSGSTAISSALCRPPEQ